MSAGTSFPKVSDVSRDYTSKVSKAGMPCFICYTDISPFRWFIKKRQIYSLNEDTVKGDTARVQRRESKMPYVRSQKRKSIRSTVKYVTAVSLHLCSPLMARFFCHKVQFSVHRQHGRCDAMLKTQKTLYDKVLINRIKTWFSCFQLLCPSAAYRPPVCAELSGCPRTICPTSPA